MEQAVMFLFLQRSKVLLEYKKGESGGFDVLSIPQGRIEERDRRLRHARDAEHALNRIIYEHFSGTVIPLQYEHIEMSESAGAGHLSLFFIYSWEGDHPMYETKRDERICKLRWMQIDDALVASVNTEQRAILKLAKEKIRIRSVLLGRSYR